MYNLRGVLHFDTMKTICEGWFTSVLVYCLPLFGGCNKYEQDDLQIIQNKIARLVTNSDNRRNRIEMYDELRWLTVAQLTAYHTLLTIQRIRETNEPEDLAQILNNENRNNKIIIPMSRLTLYRRSFIYRGITCWNTLPDSIKDIQKISNFKREVKKWIAQNMPKF